MRQGQADIFTIHWPEEIMLAWEASKEALELRRRPEDDDEFEDDGFTFDDEDEDDFDDEDEDFDDEDADFDDDEDEEIEEFDLDEDEEDAKPRRRPRGGDDL